MLYPLLPLSDPERKTTCTAAPFRDFAALLAAPAAPAAAATTTTTVFAPAAVAAAAPPPRCYRSLSPEPCFHRSFFFDGHLERMVRPGPFSSHSPSPSDNTLPEPFHTARVLPSLGLPIPMSREGCLT